MRIWTIAMLCACLGMAGVARAAQLDVPQPRQLSVLDGLPSNGINAIAEDRQGYLWIATRDGLARYDGQGFRVWQVGTGLEGNYVTSVHVDARDRVWVGTRTGGVSMLDADRRTFVNYRRATHPVMRTDEIWTITSTKDGVLWFGTADAGLIRMTPDGHLQRLAPRKGDLRSLPSLAIPVLEVDPKGRLWVGTREGLARWTGDGFERIDLPGPPRAIDKVAFDDQGNVWIALPGQGLVIRPGGEVEPEPWQDPVLGGPILHMLLVDRQGAHWLDTRSGLAREAGGRVDDVPLFSVTSRTQVRPQWLEAYEDRAGGLWFGSSDAGLWHVPANWRDFGVLTRRVDDPASPANAFVYGVAPASNGGLWLVGSGGVLDWLDPNTGRIEHKLAAVCGQMIPQAVREAADGAIWVGCARQIVRVGPGEGVVRWTSQDTQDAAIEGFTTQVAELANGQMWFSDGHEVQIRRPDGRVVQRIKPGSSHGFPAGSSINQLGRSPDGGLWASASNGLLMWNAGARRFEPVPGSPRTPVAGFAAAGNRVWLAGLGSLDAYDWDGSRLTHRLAVGTSEGLPLVMPGGLVVDGSGSVWMASSRGLVHYDPARKRVRVYGVQDGLPSQEFSANSIQLSPTGYLALGTADGLVVFHPRHVQVSDRVPNLAISGLQVRRGEALVELPRADRVELDPGDRDLRVEARLLSFVNVHSHRYRFLLEGYDDDWVATGGKGERVFASLPAGNYRLRVQARTADGDWTPEQSVDVHMAPPWWRTAWAYAAWSLGAIALLAWLAYAYRLRLKRRHAWQLAKQRQAMAEQASEAKTRFLATLGHEVRTPMTGVLGMSELLSASALDTQQRSQVNAIRRAGEHLLRLVNDSLDLARIEAGKLELETRDFEVEGLMHEVTALMAPIAEQRGLQFHESIAVDAPASLHGDRTRVAQILMNLLGNAVKFTEAGFVAIEALPLAGGGVRFAVSDSGPGLNEEQQQRLFRRFEQADGARTSARYGGSGLGLAISQELAAAMHGRIEVESTPGKGTRFIVDLPLDEAAAPAAHPALSKAAAGQGLEILLVEDDQTVADVLSGLLEARGHSVTHVAHGLAALSEVALRAFDIGLLDLDLPGLDGLALARQLRAGGFARPLVAVTARADADAESLARDAGFDGFLRKPLTGAMLERGIDLAIAARSGSV